ncbi:MAG: putative Co/Zn/Cd efflux system rane fusion protein [Capsulimonas sp.]|nr:putative Co/Zn/Cd efflux system rane fusion protein [Capsulimonas sp.]
MNNRTMALWIAGAFLIGVGGTSVVMNRRSVPAAVQAEPEAPMSAETPTDGLVKLDPIAVKNGGIEVKTVVNSPIRAALIAPGEVEASAEAVAKITPPVDGKVTRLLVSLGDRVRAGQPLAVLASSGIAQAQATVRAAESEEGQARGRVRIADAEVRQSMERLAAMRSALARQEALAKAGAFAQAPLQAAQSEQSQAQSELLQAQTELAAKTTSEARAQKLFTAGVSSRAELEQAQTDLRQSHIRVEQAQARVAQARQALTREKSVFGQGLLSRQAVQTARAETVAARSDVGRAELGARSSRTALAGAQNAVASARAQMRAIAGKENVSGEGEITLRAPISGVVTQRAVTLGEAVERTSVLLVLQDLERVTVVANVREQDVARVRVGLPVTVSVAAYPGVAFPGVVQSLGGAVDEKTRALPVRCAVQNPGGRLRPEMFAEISLATDRTRSGVVVPKDAVFDDGDAKAVFVAEEGGYRKHAVEIGLETSQGVEVRSGLKSGQRVVTDGAFVLASEAGKSELKEED